MNEDCVARLEALRLSNNPGADPKFILDTARQFYDFINGTIIDGKEEPRVDMSGLGGDHQAAPRTRMAPPLPHVPDLAVDARYDEMRQILLRDTGGAVSFRVLELIDILEKNDVYWRTREAEWQTAFGINKDGSLERRGSEAEAMDEHLRRDYKAERRTAGAAVLGATYGKKPPIDLTHGAASLRSTLDGGYDDETALRCALIEMGVLPNIPAPPEAPVAQEEAASPSKTRRANDYQPGGDHYRRAGVDAMQHWDFVSIIGLHYLPACASKYVSRWRFKNGVQDLEKALHYVHKAQEEDVKPVPVEHRQALSTFADDNRLSLMESQAIWAMMVANWSEATKLIQRLMWSDDAAEVMSGVTHHRV